MREALPKLALLAELDPDERAIVAEFLEEHRLPPGSILFEEGDDASSVLFVASGTLKVERRRVGTI